MKLGKSNLRKNLLGLCAYLCIAVITGAVIANLTAKPISLTETEISYYTEIAEKVYYEGLASVPKDATINIFISQDLDVIKVAPVNTCKQRITVDFSTNSPLVSVNKPQVSFWGCFVFYGLVVGFLIYGFIDFLLFYWRASCSSNKCK